MKNAMRSMWRDYSGRPCRPPGFTLVEVMVSMVIALIVMTGVYRTLTDETANYERNEKILDMQSNARIAMERIVKDVRLAGFLGCGGNLSFSTLKGHTTDPTTFVSGYTIATNTVTSGLDWSGSPSILSVLIGLAGAGTPVNFLSEVMGFANNAPATHDLYQEGTDALTLVYLSDERVVAAAMGNPTTQSFTITRKGFSEDDILYVTDCEGYALTQKTNGDDLATVAHTLNEGINRQFQFDLRRNYGDTVQARVYKLNMSTYFIHDNGKFELCRNTTSQQVASNIEDLQFEFLADENDDDDLTNDPWRTDLSLYPTGAAAVRAVRIWVLAMSETDYTYTDTNTYVYPNSPYAASSPAALAPITSPANGEHRHRYLASTVVLIRNAGLK